MVFCDSFRQNITFLISNQVFITLILKIIFVQEFQISKEGKITAKSSKLDYDKGMRHYALKVYATDDGHPRLTG